MGELNGKGTSICFRPGKSKQETVAGAAPAQQQREKMELVWEQAACHYRRNKGDCRSHWRERIGGDKKDFSQEAAWTIGESEVPHP